VGVVGQARVELKFRDQKQSVDPKFCEKMTLSHKGTFIVEPVTKHNHQAKKRLLVCWRVFEV
jgi:hypothetical protein